MNEKKYFNLIAKGILPRPQYALGLFLAAAVAKQQGIQKFSVIEFGCWEGEGLIDLEHYSYEIEKYLEWKLKFTDLMEEAGCRHQKIIKIEFINSQKEK